MSRPPNNATGPSGVIAGVTSTGTDSGPRSWSRPSWFVAWRDRPARLVRILQRLASTRYAITALSCLVLLTGWIVLTMFLSKYEGPAIFTPSLLLFFVASSALLNLLKR